MLSKEEKEQMRLIKNEYQREWRKKNKEKEEKIKERYWKKRIAMKKNLGGLENGR